MLKIVSYVIISIALLMTAVKPVAAADNCSNKFPINKNGVTGNLLYCSNKALQTQDVTVKRLIIVVHGTNRDANNYFGYMTSAAQSAHSTDSLIIAPHFVIPGDVNDPNALTWAQNEDWKIGSPSQSTPQIGSFAAIDQLIALTIDSKKFPNLKRVIVVGHSAGGQFTHRYSAGTQIDQKIKASGMSIRYIVANPSSYLYFTPERPVNGSETQFANPSNGSCPHYDNYKYGFKNMNPYMNALGPEKIKSQFKDKNVIYLLGDRDTDPNDSDLDKNCAAEAQGAFRYQRGNAYYGYIKHLYGDAITTNQIVAIVPGVAHDNNAMLNSEQAKQYLFDDVSNTGSVNPVPSAVCAGSTNSICQTPTPPTESITPSPSTNSSTRNLFANLDNPDSRSMLLLLLLLFLKIFTGI